jgi:hypothetical protein
VVRDEVILSVVKVFNNISNFGSSKPLCMGKGREREEKKEWKRREGGKEIEKGKGKVVKNFFI